MSTIQLSRFEFELEQKILKIVDKKRFEYFTTLAVSELFPKDWEFKERVEFLDRMVEQEKLFYVNFYGKCDYLNSYRV